MRQFLSRYSRYWWLFVISFLLAFAVAKYYNWYKNPTYAVAAKLLVKENSASKDRVLQQLDLEVPDKNIENEIEILRSYNLLSKTFAELDFDVSYFLVGDVKVSEVYKDCPFRIEIEKLDFAAYATKFEVVILDAQRFLFSYESDGALVKSEGVFGQPFVFGLGRITLYKRENFPAELLKDPKYDKRHYQIRFNTINYNQNYYLNKLQVGLARNQSTIIELYLEDEVPQKAVDFLNTHIAVYLQNDVEVKNSVASATANFLQGQLQQISEDLETIELNRQKYKMQKGIVDLDSESKMVLESVKNIDARLAENAAKLSIIQSLKTYMSNNKDVDAMAPAAMDLSDPLLIKLINKLAEVQSEREQILKNATANDPRLVPLKAEIDLTRTTLLENINNIEQSLNRKQEDYRRELARYESQIQNIPGTERELLRIERKFRVQENLYTFLMEKRAEFSIMLASTESDARLIDVARVLPGPVSPLPAKAYSVAFVLALILPVLLLYLRARLNTTVLDVQTISRITTIPILGTVGYNQSENPLVATNARSVLAEQYRNLRTNLRFFGSGQMPKTIMVTSSVGTEGKTFTALNLSGILAALQHSVILLGMDLRKPKIVSELKLQKEPGCSNFLSGQTELEQVIQSTSEVPGLHVIPSGTIPPNPSELIHSSRMKEMISKLSSSYDHVIIDTPPIGLVSDGLTLAQYADLTIFVVRQGVTEKDHLKSLATLHNSGKLANVAIVFNAVKKDYAGYGYGGSYGSGYAYGKKYGAGYYGESAEKTSRFGRFRSRNNKK